MMKVFLDLEGTIIGDWQYGELLNIDAMREFLTSNKVTEVSIFSFAVWNADDLTEFNSRLRGPLSQALGVKIVDCIDCTRMQRSDFELTRVRFENLTEFIAMRGKTEAFRNWCRIHCVGLDAVLVDDVVPNTVLLDLDTDSTTRTINVQEIQ